MSKTSDDKNNDFPIEENTFKQYRDSSTKEKLKWLEEINNFVNQTSPEKSQEIRAKFRNGDL